MVTRQYPENRATLRFPERYRASLKFRFDENGYQHCNGCGSCERACPNGSIILQTRKGEISGLVSQDPRRMGYLAVKTMVDHLKGVKVEKRVDTGATLITKDNIDSPEIQALTAPPKD